MLDITLSYMVMGGIAVAVFALIIWWCMREIIRLHKRIDSLEDKLHQWQEVDSSIIAHKNFHLKFKKTCT